MIPEAAQAKLGYHMVTFLNTDGTTVFGSQPVEEGGRIHNLSRYPQKASTDPEKIMLFSAWSVVGEGSITNVTQDFQVKPTFTEFALTTLITVSGDMGTLAGYNSAVVRNAVENVVIPETWTITRLNLGNLAYYRNIVLTFNSKITDFSNTGGKNVSHIDISKNSNFLIQDKLFLNKDKTAVFGFLDETATTFTIFSTVTTLADHAFDSAAITSLTLPADLTTIGYSALRDCPLTSLTLGSKITSIRNYAFVGTKLISFVWPSTLPSIPYGCFEYCQNLESITLPEKLTAIGDYAFEDTYSLTSVTLPSTLTHLGEGAFEDSGLTSITLPDTDGILSQSYIFRDSDLASLAIPDKVTSIGESCFEDCEKLTEVTFGTASALTTLGSYAFESSGLTSIVLPSKLTIIGTDAFYQCTSLLSADLSQCSSLTALPNDCFNYATSLATLAIPDSLVTLGNYCLADTDLKAFTITQDMQVGNNVFSGIPDIVITDERTDSILSGDVLYSDEEKTAAVMALKPMATYAAPASLVSIDGSAFEGRSSLTHLDLSAIPDGNGSLVIGNSAFAGTGLTTLTFPSEDKSLTQHLSIDMGSYAFSETALTTVTLPSMVTNVSSNTFDGCKSLTFADLSQASLTTIPYELFKDDMALESVILPKGLTALDNQIFAGCTSLKAIYLSETGPLDTDIYNLPMYPGDGWNCISSTNYGPGQDGGLSAYAELSLQRRTAAE
jgi:hypothetical protein